MEEEEKSAAGGEEGLLYPIFWEEYESFPRKNNNGFGSFLIFFEEKVLQRNLCMHAHTQHIYTQHYTRSSIAYLQLASSLSLSCVLENSRALFPLLSCSFTSPSLLFLKTEHFLLSRALAHLSGRKPPTPFSHPSLPSPPLYYCMTHTHGESV